ncbi:MULTISPECIES: sec-independent translocase [Streptomyces]|jgi:sec-independent protein translocase protein TatB|uniref:Sec-independent translocase n=1 Tax=Streptomyces spinosisporus TaxID=2927582 RepID=A0ABS9XF39_9ACTN|nr:MULTISPECIES: sec-independent translocase [Streptomyces]MCI3240618.1 sec-independent translocase [Streptomyces spinosisporus]WUB37223.1 sec-independent translocase [Streptomyces sp. NBC_00588]
MFSDVGPLELVTLVILAVLLFGPDKLPEIIQNVAEFLRKVRAFSDSAKEEIRSELGPEFKDFEFEDLHPKTFVRKHVLDGEELGLGSGLGLDEIRGALDPRKELTEAADAVREAAEISSSQGSATRPVTLTKPEHAEAAAPPVFDKDAT